MPLIPNDDLLTEVKRRQETPESYSWRDLYLLLDLSRPDSRLLYRRTDVAPPSKVLLLLHGT
jgi:hypothetical protein